jgi:SAM-dependent methyltransferase
MRVSAVARATTRRGARLARNAWLDLRYGRFLGGTVTTRFAHLGAFDTANSDYDDLAGLFAAAGLSPDDVIVDVGCGRGRVLNWLLAHHPENVVYGIELDPEIAAATARRLRRHPSVRIVCGDATELLPVEATVFYLFNPFEEHVVRRFAESVLRLGDDGLSRERRIVYYRSKFLAPFRDSDRFRIERIDLPSRSHDAALITLSATGAAEERGAGGPSARAAAPRVS